MLEQAPMHPINAPRGDQLGNVGRRARFARSSAIGTHRALFQDEGERRCDACDAVISADQCDGGSGLFVWTRGEEVRYEEPPLCEKCGPAIALSAMRRWEEEDEEEG